MLKYLVLLLVLSGCAEAEEINNLRRDIRSLHRRLLIVENPANVELCKWYGKRKGWTRADLYYSQDNETAYCMTWDGHFVLLETVRAIKEECNE